MTRQEQAAVISEATAVLTARLAEFTVVHSASRDENPCLHHRPCGRHVDDIGDGDTGADLVLLMLGHTCA